MKSKEFFVDALHVFALSGFAVAQPIFNLLEQYPVFFVARKSQPIDLVLFVALVSLAVPLLLILVEFAAGLMHRRFQKSLHYCLVALLAMVILLPALNKFEALPGWLAVSAAGLAGVAVLAAYIRLEPLRSFVTLLAVAAIVFPMAFAFDVSIRELLMPAGYKASEQFQEATNPVPIVFVVFDEFPVTSLMNDQFQIDSSLFPGFAALSNEAWWFRYAHTVDGATHRSVPSILTGNRPPEGRSFPTLQQYPNNLFTWLRGNYQIKSYEAKTTLCPEGECTDLRVHEQLPTINERMSYLLSDAGVVFLHLVAPISLTKYLPSISNDWEGFFRQSQPSGNEKSYYSITGVDKPRLLDAFIDAIVPTRKPTLYFMHVVLPHIPWIFYPSGKRYDGFDYDMDSLASNTRQTTWVDDEYLVSHGVRRHLLQVQLVDRFISRLIDKMKHQKLYNSSLVVVTADHGVGFNPGWVRRSSPRENDLRIVPMFIKFPGKNESKTIDRKVETIDLVPTIAEVIGLPLPWAVEGKSLLSFTATNNRISNSGVVSPAQMAQRYETVGFLDRAFDRHSPNGLYSYGPYHRFSGELTARLTLGERIADIEVAFDDGADFGLDPDSNFVPGLIVGSLSGSELPDESMDLAVGVNGVIRVLTRSYTLGERTRFSVLLPENSLQPGENHVELYWVLEDQTKSVRFLPLSLDEKVN